MNGVIPPNMPAREPIYVLMRLDRAGVDAADDPALEGIRYCVLPIAAQRSIEGQIARRELHVPFAVAYGFDLAMEKIKLAIRHAREARGQ